MMFNNYGLKKKLYKIVLIFVILLSVLSIGGNRLLGFPLEVNIKWFFLMIISILSYKFDYKIKNMQFFYFLFIILFYMPFAFIDSGGSENNFVPYTFLVLIITSYIFQGKKRNILIFLLILDFVIMMAVEYYFPNLIAVHNQKTQFLDRLFQVPMLLLASATITKKFADSYLEINKKLYNYAHYDDLTSTYNRRSFNDTIKKCFEKNKEEYNLILIDLDNFKDINDNYGHLTGDELLCFSAELLKKDFLDIHDFISRWGGDEFALITKKKIHEIKIILENMREKIEKHTENYEFKLSMSYGVVQLGNYKNIDEAFKHTDKELYAYKKKNKIRD